MTRAPDDAAKADPLNPIRRNVAAIAAVEDTARRERTPAERTIDAITQFVGRPLFFFLQVGWIGSWLAWNVLASRHVFDPPPFFRLDGVLSIEAIMISTFVLISQNRMAAAYRRRGQLSLQVNMLAEAEMTNALNLLHRISRHLGLPDPETDVEGRELAQRTDIAEVARRVDEELTPAANPRRA